MNKMAEAEQEQSDEIYHERQRLQMCAVHAINNLFQDGSAINKATMNDICKNLSPDTYWNPHKSILGVGNYDVNAIMVVLGFRGYEIVWFDKRRLKIISVKIISRKLSSYRAETC